jgi:septum formation protein
LLAVLGIPFSVVPSSIDESPALGEDPEAFVVRAAKEKCMEVASRVSQSVVLSADTVVTIDGEILGKPADEQEAVRMLKKLSGRDHWFKPLDNATLLDYVRRENLLDKAGAYAIQGYAGVFIPKIEGNYFNVMGLPLPLVYELLRNSGTDA